MCIRDSTKPIDNWNSIDLRRNITAGDAVTPISSPVFEFRAKGTYTVPIPSENLLTVQPAVKVVTQKSVAQGA